MEHHDLKDCVGYQLIQLMRAHRHQAEKALNAVGLYAGQEVILFQLWRDDGLPQAHLAEVLGVEPPTVTKMVQRMETAGFVERRADPTDARVSRVFLTTKGRDLEQPVSAIWQHLESTLTTGLSEVEVALLRRMIGQMCGNMRHTLGKP